MKKLVIIIITMLLSMNGLWDSGGKEQKETEVLETQTFKPTELMLAEMDLFKIKTDMGSCTFSPEDEKVSMMIEICNTSSGSVEVSMYSANVNYEECDANLEMIVPNDGEWHSAELDFENIDMFYQNGGYYVDFIYTEFLLKARDDYAMAVTHVNLYNDGDGLFENENMSILKYLCCNLEYFMADYRPKETTQAGTDSLGWFQLVGTGWKQELSEENRISYVLGDEKIVLERIVDTESNKEAVTKYMDETIDNMSKIPKNRGTYETAAMYADYFSDHYALGEQYFRAYFYSEKTQGIMHLEIDSETMEDVEFEELINVLLYSYSNAEFGRYTVDVDSN